MKTTIVLVIDHKKPIPDLLKLVEGRVYNLDRVEDCNAVEGDAALADAYAEGRKDEAEAREGGEAQGLTADGVAVKAGDRVWVRGSVGVHEATVQPIVMVTNYELFGPIPVCRSYSTESAAKSSRRKAA